MTEEEKKAKEAEDAKAAAEKKASDDLAGFWVGEQPKPEPKAEDAPKESDVPDIDVQNHSGGVAETMRRIKLKQELEAKGSEESTSLDDEPKDKPGDDESKKKPKVKFSLRPKPEQKVEPKVDDPAPNLDEPAPKKGDAPKKEGELSADDSAFVESLPDELKDSIEFWRDAEAVDPDKYKGKAAAQLDYLKRFQAEADRLKDEDEDFDPETSHELRRWVSQQTDRPHIGLREQREVIEKKLDKKLQNSRKEQASEAEQRRRISEERPKAEKAIEEFSDGISSAIPGDVMETFSSGADVAAGLEAVADEHGASVADAIKSTIVHSTQVAEAYVNLTRGLEPYDEKNPLHADTINTVVELGRIMMETPELEKHRTDSEGRTFIPREKYYSSELTPEVRSKHFTFTEKQVLDMIADRSKKALSSKMEAAVQKEKEIALRRAKRYGYSGDNNQGANASQNDTDPPPGRIPSSGEKRDDKGSNSGFWVRSTSGGGE